MRYGSQTVAIEHEQRIGFIVGFILFFACTDFFDIVMGENFPAGPVRYIFTAMMLAFALVHVRFLLRAAFGAPEMTLLLVLVLASTLWSIEPELTFKRAMQISCLSAFTMALAAMLSLRSLILMLAAVMGVAMIASLFAVILVPDARGTEQWPSAWRGLFNHKNGLGTNTVIALILLSVSISMTRGWARGVYAVMWGASFLLLAECESRTSQMIAVFCLGGLFVAFAMRAHVRIWMILFLAIFILGMSLATLSLTTGIADPLFEALGRKPTLSNRIPLWIAVWPDVMKEFWTGYGYESFWDPEGPRVLRIERIPLLGFTPHYSHNGLVEMLLNVGIAGVPLFVIGLVRALLGASAVMKAHAMRPAGAGAVALIVAFIMYNVTENLILNINTFGWTVFLALATKLSLMLSRQSRRWLRRPTTGRRSNRRGSRTSSFAGA